jgi:fructose/tagatose bisphosphate aldolase
VRPRIVVHALDDARAALRAAAEAGCPLLLASAPGAGCYAGAGWFAALVAAARAEFPDADLAAELDCADQPGAALAALRAGVAQVRFRPGSDGGNAEAAARLGEIAGQLGATLETGEPPPGLDLRHARDAAALCRAFLAGNAPAT